MREERKKNLKGIRGEGITPACAGRTRSIHLLCLSREDHPRVCGKNDYTVSPGAQLEGSPPRVREERHKSIRLRGLGGITPACAGRTTAVRECIALGRDHPRVCGKNPPPPPNNNFNGGSPPRVREELLMRYLRLL